MKLLRALELDQEYAPQMISFIGGGGKTSSIFKLARELSQIRKKVLITTTTAMYDPGRSKDPNITILGDHVTEEGKLKGILKDQADQIFQERRYHMILVEADGSRGLPVKAPAAHEPPIPGKSTIVAGVIGTDCFRRPIIPAYVHRPEYFTQLTDSAHGDIIQADILLKLITRPEGLFKNSPPGSKKAVILNKVTTEERKEMAIDIAEMVLKQKKEIDRVLICTVQEEDPVRMCLKRGDIWLQ